VALYFLPLFRATDETNDRAEKTILDSRSGSALDATSVASCTNEQKSRAIIRYLFVTTFLTTLHRHDRRVRPRSFLLSTNQIRVSARARVLRVFVASAGRLGVDDSSG
jgi:hypothetical protein